MDLSVRTDGLDFRAVRSVFVCYCYVGRIFSVVGGGAQERDLHGATLKMDTWQTFFGWYRMHKFFFETLYFFAQHSR